MSLRCDSEMGVFHCLNLYIGNEREPWIVQEGGKLGTKSDTGLQKGPTKLGVSQELRKGAQCDPEVIQNVCRYVGQGDVQVGANDVSAEGCAFEETPLA